MNTLIRLMAILSLGAILGACDEGRVRPPPTGITIVHAAPSFTDINFYRSPALSRPESTLSFLGAARLSFDADLYNYALGTIGSNGVEQSAGVFTHRTDPNRTYTYVFAEAGGNIEPLIFEEPAAAPSATGAEFSIVHASEPTAAVDVYVEPPGTAPGTTSARATLSFRDRLAPISVPAGDYVVTITESGVSANVLFTSGTLTLPAGQRRALVIANGAGSGVSDLVLIAAGESTTSVVDVNAGSAVRAINGAGDRLGRDVYASGDFSAPLIAATAFGTASDFTAISTAATTIAITPEGNASVIEREITQSLVNALIYNLIIAGDSTTGVDAILAADNHRVITDQARIQVVNAVNFYDVVDFYLLPLGTDITTVPPTFQLPSPGTSVRQAAPVDDLDLTLRDPASGTILFGPQTLTIPAAGIYTIVAVDSADGTTADILLLDDFLP